ncbi:MAG: flavodoxin family protein [Desulfobulbaceae bacterium]|nr:flavodoxin family protein [Desulfobulbaceae bacterium]
MKVIAINGSARKTWNTGTLLQQALAGAASIGAATELLHLYDLDYKGCTSCFACKMVGGSSEGRCAMQDGATPLLQRIEREANVLILGSPIYFGSMSGEMHSFLERLLFAPFVYSNPGGTLFPRRIRTGFIYTMNVNETISTRLGYEKMFAATAGSLQRILGESETFCSYDTCQFPDYSKVVMEYLDPVHKQTRRQEVFPGECQRAFEFGRRLAGG